MPNFEPFWKQHLVQGLTEDQWQWDWTTLGAVATEKNVRARLIAKSNGVWAATGLMFAMNDVVRELGAKSDSGVEVKMKCKDGQLLEAGELVCEWEGPARLVLALERPVLNLAAFACGIATQTREFVSRVHQSKLEPEPRVTLTRKTLPGYKDLSVHAVKMGGGYPHRLNLGSGALIKENHIAAAGGIRAAIEGV